MSVLALAATGSVQLSKAQINGTITANLNPPFPPFKHTFHEYRKISPGKL
jgi:hypothetical protein